MTFYFVTPEGVLAEATFYFVSSDGQLIQMTVDLPIGS